MLCGAARTKSWVAPSRRFRFRVLATVSLFICSACGDSDLDGYYPLEAGRAWRYQVSVIQQGGALSGTAIVANLPRTTVFGRSGVPQRSDLFGKTVVRFMSATGGGIMEYAQQAGSAPPVSEDPPDYVLRTPVTAGTSWASVWRSTNGRISFPTVKTIIGTRETVMVPAGTFAECLQVKITGKEEVALLAGPATIEVAGEEWYAPDVGFIKGAFRETVNQGEATSELSMHLESFGGQY